MITPKGVVPTGAFVRVVRDDEGHALQLFGHHCPVFDLKPDTKKKPVKK